ncbi:hypothetical protein [Saccharothrix xinjiangensis]|uniref:Single-stranded DNA-binding protein n=1 Tax=Saccharothrix xinjiangensis TaxID=204798 RepID=A0ABV9XY88_9PSEU
MPEQIKSVKAQVPQGVELSDGNERGVKVVVRVKVERVKGKPDTQELRGTYRFDPNPHDYAKYNDKNEKGKFYGNAARAAARLVETRTDDGYALVPVEHFEFKFGRETYRATPWTGPMPGTYKNKWRVDGPEQAG